MNQKKFNQIFVPYINCQIEENDFLLNSIIPAGTLSAIDALEIYRDDYFARLKETLGHHYPRSQSLIPENLWDNLLIDYIKRYPSTFKNLEDYGELLVEEIENYQDEIKRDFPFLIDVLRFELNFKKLFHQRQIRGFDAKKLINAVQNDEAISLVSSHFLIHSNYNIQENLSIAETHFKAIEEHLLGIKLDDQIKIFNLSKSQFHFLKFFQTPNKMSLALEKLEDNLTPLDLESIFKILGNYQLIH